MVGQSPSIAWGMVDESPSVVRNVNMLGGWVVREHSMGNGR